eukprot:365092-Chlamydomonas_euryale.AAC.2
MEKQQRVGGVECIQRYEQWSRSMRGGRAHGTAWGMEPKYAWEEGAWTEGHGGAGTHGRPHTWRGGGSGHALRGSRAKVGGSGHVLRDSMQGRVSTH